MIIEKLTNKEKNQLKKEIRNLMKTVIREENKEKREKEKEKEEKKKQKELEIWIKNYDIKEDFSYDFDCEDIKDTEYEKILKINPKYAEYFKEKWKEWKKIKKEFIDKLMNLPKKI
jgi:tRNA U34 5-carboxymethylaminomethyl modifying enzyme MnmG/GidA